MGLRMQIGNGFDGFTSNGTDCLLGVGEMRPAVSMINQAHGRRAVRTSARLAALLRTAGVPI